MFKRVLSIVLCLCFMFSLCAFAEGVVGTYKVEPGIITNLLLSMTNQQFGIIMGPVLEDSLSFEFDAEGYVSGKLFIADINDFVFALEDASKTDYSAREISRTYWNEVDGSFYLISSIGGEYETVGLSSGIEDESMTVIIEDSLPLRFNRCEGTSGYSGIWQHDMEYLKQLLAQMPLDQLLEGYTTNQILDAISTLDIYLYLKDDNSIGFSFVVCMGTYQDGTITYAPELLELVFSMQDISMTSSYSLEGDKISVVNILTLNDMTETLPIMLTAQN